jgi:hypothetical protein
VRVDSGPADPALRRARVCYDHLAGDLGVLVFDSMKQPGLIGVDARTISLTDAGTRFCASLDIDIDALARGRRPLCLACLDWSERRHHLAGSLGAALLRRFIGLEWARLRKGSRVVVFSALGEQALRRRFRLVAR